MKFIYPALALTLIASFASAAPDLGCPKNQHPKTVTTEVSGGLSGGGNIGVGKINLNGGVKRTTSETTCVPNKRTGTTTPRPPSGGSRRGAQKAL